MRRQITLCGVRGVVTFSELIRIICRLFSLAASVRLIAIEKYGKNMLRKEMFTFLCVPLVRPLRKWFLTQNSDLVWGAEHVKRYPHRLGAPHILGQIVVCSSLLKIPVYEFCRAARNGPTSAIYGGRPANGETHNMLFLDEFLE